MDSLLRVSQDVVPADEEHLLDSAPGEANTVTPEFFLAHYMHFIAMTISNGHPSKDTLDSYRKSLHYFLTWCFKKAHVNPLKLKENHLEYYRSRLYEKKTESGTYYNQNSVHNQMSAIKAFYHAAVKQHLLKLNPCEEVTAPSINANDIPFSYYKMSEIKEIVDYIKKDPDEFACCRNLAMIYLMAVAGLRCVEVYRSNREDINWDNGTMIVHGKGHNGVVYLDASTIGVLLQYIDCVNRLPLLIQKEEGLTPLFVTFGPNSSGKRIKRNSIRYNMDKILKGAGMKKQGATCHVFRHSCATALYEKTHDLRVVQDTLRHRSPNVTARYAHVVEQLEKRPTAALGKMLD